MSEIFTDGVPITQASFTNSYVTLDEAQDYFDARLSTDAWDDAEDTDKQKSLYQATRLIDRLNFEGLKWDPVQVLEFPRRYTVTIDWTTQPPTYTPVNEQVVPLEIKIATCEIALYLLDGVDPEQELNNLSSTSQGYGSIRESYDRTIRSEHYRAGIPSAVAWTYLKPFLHDAAQISFVRV